MARPIATRRIVLVGHGLLGGPLASLLRGAGAAVLTVAGRGADHGVDLGADLTTRSGRRALATLLAEQRPTCVVLAHGPGDVTWIEQNEDVARAAHEGTARAVRGHRVLLVSTDNVFDGAAPARTVDDPVCPGNAYGRVKLAAERAVLEGRAPSTVARISLVYGWSAPGRRATYGHRCVEAARAGRPIVAPVDQLFTPVHVDDAVASLAALALDVENPAGRVVHLAGPVELSRHEFARLAYLAAGADPGLIVPKPRAQTEWACRPRHSSLFTGDATALAPLREWRPRAPQEGLAHMVRTARRWAPGLAS